MKPLPYLSVCSLALAGVKAASHVRRNSTGPFLQQLDEQTWVIGNELWNLTQQATYGVQLYYKDQDCVGDAVGHYVSYSTSEGPRDLPTILHMTLSSTETYR